MHRSVLRALLPAVALSACAPWPYRYGPFAMSLPDAEVSQIIALVQPRSDIRKPVSDIEMVRPNEAIVRGGPVSQAGALVTVFTIHKKNGNWLIVDSSIREEEAIVTE